MRPIIRVFWTPLALVYNPDSCQSGFPFSRARGRRRRSRQSPPALVGRGGGPGEGDEGEGTEHGGSRVGVGERRRGPPETFVDQCQRRVSERDPDPAAEGEGDAREEKARYQRLAPFSRRDAADERSRRRRTHDPEDGRGPAEVAGRTGREHGTGARRLR